MDSINERLQVVINELFDGNKAKFAKAIGIAPTSISNYLGEKRQSKPSSDMLEKILNSVEDISADWLLTGNGEMLKQPSRDNTPRSTDTTTANLIPLLPIAAQGGSLNDFASAIKNCDCEFVISPIKGADFAMPISGDSMAPEYPNGAQILIKKIDESAFVEWGKAYVLDTRNGAVVKILVPSDKEDCVRCVSINKDPIFAPFDVCWRDVFGVYRVMMCMTLK